MFESETGDCVLCLTYSLVKEDIVLYDKEYWITDALILYLK